MSSSSRLISTLRSSMVLLSWSRWREMGSLAEAVSDVAVAMLEDGVGVMEDMLVE